MSCSFGPKKVYAIVAKQVHEDLCVLRKIILEDNMAYYDERKPRPDKKPKPSPFKEKPKGGDRKPTIGDPIFD